MSVLTREQDALANVIPERLSSLGALLTEHRNQLDQLSRALPAAETLDAVDVYAAAGVGLKMPARA